MNTSVKLLSASLSPVQLLWSRNLGDSIFILALFAPHFGWRLVRTGKPAIQLTRSLMLLISSSFFFFAIGHVPLADATSAGFTAPFIVALLAGPVLGERVGLGHWLAIAAGFCGALIVIRPTGGGANLYALLILGSAACYAVYQLLTRRMAGVDPPETSVTYSALVGTVVLSLLVPFFWRTPDGAAPLGCSSWPSGSLAAWGTILSPGASCGARRRSCRRCTTCSSSGPRPWATWCSATCPASSRGWGRPSSSPAASGSPGGGAGGVTPPPSRRV